MEQAEKAIWDLAFDFEDRKKSSQVISDAICLPFYLIWKHRRRLDG
jgi:hypothetical protein